MNDIIIRTEGVTQYIKESFLKRLSPIIEITQRLYYESILKLQTTMTESKTYNYRVKNPSPCPDRENDIPISEEHRILFNYLSNLGFELKYESAHTCYFINEKKNWFLQLYFEGDVVTIWNLSSKLAKLDLDGICIASPKYSQKPVRPKDNSINFEHYFIDPSGNHFSRSFKLFGERLSDILELNYCDKVVEQTRSLFRSLKDNTLLGKFLVLHGFPGTGKTFWIKDLAFQLGNYTPITLSQAKEFFKYPHYYYNLFSRYEDSKLLIICEDSGDMFSPEMRAEQTDVISSMLNVTDGLLAAGRRDIYIFTFNYEIEKLDDAILRPGRCIDMIKFDKLGKEKVRKFLEAHHHENGSPEDEMSLAELYSLVYGTLNEKNVGQKIGF